MARKSLKTAVKKTKPTRRDGRKSFLVYLDQDLIKALKKAAVDLDRHGYEIVEEAVTRWLDENPAR